MCLTLGNAAGPEEIAPSYGALWWVLRGQLWIETSTGESATLNDGEFTVVPAETRYRLSTAQPTLMLTLRRGLLEREE